jgi:hypothetical protein
MSLALPNFFRIGNMINILASASIDACAVAVHYYTQKVWQITYKSR